MYCGHPRALYALTPDEQGDVLAIWEARALDAQEAHKRAKGGR
jgi:hypothetical protein